MEPFYDKELELQIHTNMTFEPSRYKYCFKAALDQIKAIENGEIINKTSVEKESENRQVDHYNLRMAEEKVPGKSLEHTLKQWKDIQAFGEANMKKFKHVIFNGIGGSYLGPYMLLCAMYGDEYNAV